MLNGVPLPMPLGHLQYHPELMDDEMDRKIDTIHIQASVCAEFLAPGLVGLGEVMQTVEEEGEGIVDGNMLTNRSKRIGVIIDTFAILTIFANEVHKAAGSAMEHFTLFREGRYALTACPDCDQPCGHAVKGGAQ